MRQSSLNIIQRWDQIIHIYTHCIIHILKMLNFECKCIKYTGSVPTDRTVQYPRTRNCIDNWFHPTECNVSVMVRFRQPQQ